MVMTTVPEKDKRNEKVVLKINGEVKRIDKNRIIIEEKINELTSLKAEDINLLGADQRADKILALIFDGVKPNEDLRK